MLRPLHVPSAPSAGVGARVRGYAKHPAPHPNPPPRAGEGMRTAAPFFRFT